MTQRTLAWRIGILLLPVLAYLSLPSYTAAKSTECQQALYTFSSDPNDRTYAELTPLDREGCWPESSLDVFLSVVRYWAARGNPWAAQYLAEHLDRFVGGDSELAFLALGKFSDHDVTKFLLFAKQGLLSRASVEDASGMVFLNPAKFSGARLTVLLERRRSILAVKRKDLELYKAWALTTINGLVIQGRSLNSKNADHAHNNGSACHQALDAFTSHPTERTLAGLKQIKQTGCWPTNQSDYWDMMALLEFWAKRGNPWAAQFLAKSLDKLDGGDLEDAFRALGDFSERDMTTFLLFAKRGILSKRNVEDAQVMLSLELVDHAAVHSTVLRKRRDMVLAVKRKDLEIYKTWALTAIDESIETDRPYDTVNTLWP